MPKLVMSDPSGREQVYEIGSEPQVWGRGEDSDVILGSRSVTRHHMRIWAEDEAIMVEDLTGGKGLEVEGESVTGTFELEPGKEMTAGVFVFRVHGFKMETAVDAEPLEEKKPVPLLRGLRGPAAGVEIELQEGANDVGRDPAAYIVIEEASISRLHARLTVDPDGGVELVDLRSSNGTFVNNKRIDKVRLQAGDKVRFGNVQFRFLVEGAGGMADLKRKKIIIIASAAALLLVLVLVICAKGRRGRGGHARQVAVQQELPLELQVEQHLREAKGAMEKLRWKDALAEVDKALDLHPISAEANKLKKKITSEMANKSIYEEGIALYDLNKWKEALKIFEKIPADSIYYQKIKYKISEVRKKQSEYHFTEGKSYYSAHDYKNAQRHFIEYMKLNPCDRKVYLKWLKKTEARMRHYEIRYRPYVYNCTDASAETSVETAEVDPLEVLKNEYPNPKIFKVMKLYFVGKGKLAIDALRRLKVLDNNPKVVEQAKQLERVMMVVVGKYNEGLAYLLQGDITGARNQFELVLSHDAKIMPAGLHSFYRESSSKKLGERLYKEGLGQFNREEYFKAFKLWQECLQMNPDDTSCQQGLMKLEAVAEEVLQMARQLEARGDTTAIKVYKNVMRISRPTSLPYKKAVSALARLK